MRVIYRLSPYLSSNPNPMGRDKPKIVVDCLMSFLNATKLEYPITFINDGFDEEFANKHLRPYGEVVQGNGGNVETFHQQLDMACKYVDEEHVFLVEDDYMWRPDSIHLIDEALNEVSLISPYDHPGHYTEDRFKYQPKLMMKCGEQVYRQAPSNTLTFACRVSVIRYNLDLIKSFKLRDHEMFQALGVDLWVPVPSIGSHCVTGLEAKLY